MNPETLGLLRGLATLFAMIAFIGVWIWAWGRKRKQKFDDAARLPLEEDAP
jgi:cytochrome c oxidase cbb3-type subunit 4